MPAGTPYFAWIDATETTFTSAHLRWDENIFSFKLSQDEGDPAALTLVVRRPRNASGDPIGLLGPGRKIWCWFALDCDGTNLIKFRGRLVGIPTDIFQELVTLDFVARPIDIVAQKATLAASLAVLPFFDAALIEPSRLNPLDPEVVLEGYTAIWHYDRETHVLTISDEITGEDGTVVFDASDAANTVLYDGLGLSLTSGPLAKASVTAEFNWTQSPGAGSSGKVDLTQYLIASWPPNPHYPIVIPGAIMLDESNWPKPGAGLGGGWTVADSTATNMFNTTTRSQTTNSQVTTIFPDGDSVKGTSSSTETKVNPIANFFGIQTVVTADQTTWKTEKDGDGGTYTASFNRNFAQTKIVLSIQMIKPTLIATWSAGGAGRQIGEKISITLVADVQPILTDPADGEQLIIDDIRSVNLSETVNGEIPIGDPGRDSYIATERGNLSIQYLILLLRANLMKRARVVEITFAPPLERMPEITLRKNGYLVEPRIGQATGKFTHYSVSLDGSDGHIKCEATIGCTIGNGGSVVASAGTETYVTTGYVSGGYQQFTGQFVAIDTSVTYSPPNSFFNPNSINFLSGNLTAADVIEVGLTVEYGAVPTVSQLPPISPGEDAVQIATDFVNAYWMPQFETKAKFKLKDANADLTGDQANQYTIDVSELKIPTGYDLAAA